MYEEYNAKELNTLHKYACMIVRTNSLEVMVQWQIEPNIYSIFNMAHMFAELCYIPGPMDSCMWPVLTLLFKSN